MIKLNIGYGSNGGITDHKITSSGEDAVVRDATSFYLWSILGEFQKLGHTTYRLLEDTCDKYAIRKLGDAAFNYAASYRKQIFDNWHQISTSDADTIESLDLVIWEWRWPIPGRNTKADKGRPGYSSDYEDQCRYFELFNKYKVPVMVFDQDYKLTVDDIKNNPCIVKVLDFGTKWSSDPSSELRSLAVDVDLCFDFSFINTYDIEQSDGYALYVGNRYERDWCIDKYLPDGTNVYGNWLDHGYDSNKRWPQFKFCPRIQPYNFHKAYKNSACVPLLAKKSYSDYGFMTARLLETVFYGSIPLFISEFSRNDRFCPKELRDALYIKDKNFMDRINSLSYYDRCCIVSALRKFLSFTDASVFVDKILYNLSNS